VRKRLLAEWIPGKDGTGQKRRNEDERGDEARYQSHGRKPDHNTDSKASGESRPTGPHLPPEQESSDPVRSFLS
jgi:hypothetical protein